MPANPFKADIFPDGLPLTEGASLVHASELEGLLTLLEEHVARTPEQAQEGNVILLKAPRAGYGKSHLLAALQLRLAESTHVLAPVFDLEHEFRWMPFFWESIGSFHQAPVGTAGLTKLDQLTRQLFGLLNAELIREKRVPCSNPEAAIHALLQRSLELFDLNDPRQAVGKWFAEHFERLLPVTSHVLAKFSGITQESATVWLRALCAYTQGVPEGDVIRFEHFRWAIQHANGGGVMAGGMNILTAPTLDESFFKDRLVEFLRLASMARPMLLIFDHLDVVHGHAGQTMRVASVITEFRRLLPRALIVLSVNQDLWAGSFQKFLPSALEDRLNGGLIDLKEINAQQGQSLLADRLKAAGIPEADASQFIAAIQLPHWFAREPGRFSAPRTLLRHAARAWEHWIKRSLQQPPAAPAETPKPAAPPASAAAAPVQPPAAKSESFVIIPQEAEAAPEDSGEQLPMFQSGLPMGGNGTSFQQLKVMLEKLRLERIASGKPPLPMESGTILREAQTPEPAEEAAPTAPEAPKTDAALVDEQFHQLKQRLLGAKPLRVDQDLLCHLIGVGGKRLAVVKASHIPLPASNGPGAMLWQTPDGEILFGTEAHEDRTYWQALLAYARQRFAAGTPNRTHLTIFSASQEPVDLQWWMPAEDAASALNRYVDVVSLDPEALATLYAADELIHAAEHTESSPVTPDEVFAAVSPYLETFWRRLTRVLKAES